jgi:hypothetical protein
LSPMASGIAGTPKRAASSTMRPPLAA